MAVTKVQTHGASPKVHVPAVNTAAVVTLAAPNDTQRRNRITAIVASYNAAPTAGRLTITDNAVTVFDMDINAAGVYVIQPPSPMRFGLGTAVVVTLAAAGAAVQSKLNVLAYEAERD